MRASPKAEQFPLAPSDPRCASLELAGAAILVADGAVLGVVRYAITLRASHTGEWTSAGILYGSANLIDKALRGGTITLRDETDAVELGVVLVRHEIGASEADIMLDDDRCLSLAEAIARPHLYALASGRQGM